MENANAFVSIIITSYNYAKWLPESIESALHQNYDNFEIIIVDDGSTDDSKKIIEKYKNQNKIKYFFSSNSGLAATCNFAISKSSGEYIVRLDADDIFDPNLLRLESEFLSQNLEIGMVFSDYFVIDSDGQLLEYVHREKIDDSKTVFDRSCLPVGAMYRRECFDHLDGYKGKHGKQEDYNFWINFIEKYKVRNLNLPLVKYRKHANSMSTNFDIRMKARAEIKQDFAKEHRQISSETLAIVPIKVQYINGVKSHNLKINGLTLLEIAIQNLHKCTFIKSIVISTDDDDLRIDGIYSDKCKILVRGKSTRKPNVKMEEIVGEVLSFCIPNDEATPSIIAIIHPHSPLIREVNIREAINTLHIFNVDSVIAVIEDLTFHWRAGVDGLVPVGYQKRFLKEEKDLIYKEAGGLYVFWTKNVSLFKEILGVKVGHVELSKKNGFRIYDDFDYKLLSEMKDEY